MADIATAYVQIVPSARGMKAGLSNIFGNEMPSAGQNAGSLLGSSMASAIKRTIAAAGIGAALNKALTEGAALEQSIGGIKTLFKGSADAVIANAQQAYRTAGMSANSYMEQVASFSASLLQSLGGNTVAAVNVADMALQDMSDNANKFGTDMGRITDAYQGFAKQNYTMLDNLKLGYGGTKTEMQRLLAHAQELTGVKYDINNLSDVYNAIHEIQKELEITGATADEAGTTLTGSFNAMKAALSDVLGNMPMGFDMSSSLHALTSTTVTFLRDNLTPAIKNVVTALPGALGTFFEGVLPDNMSSLAVSMVNNLAAGLDSSIPQLLSRALPMVTEFTGNLRSNAGMLADAGISLILNLGQGIINSIPTLVQNVPQIITNICSIINDNMPKLFAAGLKLIWELGKGIIHAGPTILENFPSIIKSIMSVFSAANWLNLGSSVASGIGKGIKAASPSNVISSVQNLVNQFTTALKTHFPKLIENGTQMIINIIQGILNAIPNFQITIGTIMDGLMVAFEAIWPKALEAGFKILLNIVTGLTNALPNLIHTAGALINHLGTAFINALPTIMSHGAKIIASLISGIISNLPAIISSGTTVIAQLLSTFAAHLPDLLAQGISLIGQLIAGLISMIPDVISGAGDIIKNICDAFGETDWIQLGKDIIEGIISGLWNAATGLYSAVKSIIQNALSKGKEEAEVNSPSKLFRRELGRHLPSGAALGVRDNSYLVENAVQDMIGDATSGLRSSLRMNADFSGAEGGFGRPIIIYLNVYSEAKTAADLMREARYEAEKAVLLGV